MARASRGRGKVGKAAVQRAVAVLQEQQTQARELPPNLKAVIDRHPSNTLTMVEMDLVRPLLREVITGSTLTGEESVRKHCTHICALAEYAIKRNKPLTVAALLTTTFIDEYVRSGMQGQSDALRRDRRLRLLNLARHVNPGPDAPAKLASIGRSAIRPCYTPLELAIITRAALTQPTPGRRTALCAVVGLGAGAGCDSVDLRHLRVRHVEDQGEDGVLVHVQGPRPRVVPVRRGLEPVVRAAVLGCGPDELVIGEKEDRRNTGARAGENAVLLGVPQIQPARLRATWLADLMTDVVPIGVLLQAAGLQSARTLTDLLPHLQPWLDHKGLTQLAAALRGGGA